MGKKHQPEMQVEKIMKSARQNSKDTRFRYWDSAKLFARYIAEEYNVQNLKNMNNKHLASFVKYRQDQGIAPKTIYNDLGAIRYLHKHIVNPRYQEIATNQELRQKHNIDFQKVQTIKGNRAWTEDEYQSFKKLAVDMGHQRYADAMTLGRHMGLRVSEAYAMHRSQAKKALETGVYQVKNEAKNGKWRKVPLTPEARKVLDRVVKDTPRGDRLFTYNNETVHRAYSKYQDFLGKHRHKVETEEGRKLRTYTENGEVKTWTMTSHGLRYAYIQDRVQEEMDKGFTLQQAALRVTKEVGHERSEVIGVYIGENIQ